MIMCNSFDMFCRVLWTFQLLLHCTMLTASHVSQEFRNFALKFHLKMAVIQDMGPKHTILNQTPHTHTTKIHSADYALITHHLRLLYLCLPFCLLLKLTHIDTVMQPIIMKDELFGNIILHKTPHKQSWMMELPPKNSIYGLQTQ